MANARREADKDLLKKLGDVAKLKGNSFYGKKIEDLGRNKSTKFTREERVVDKALTSPVFHKFSERTPGLFKPEFLGTRSARLTAKYYLVQDQYKIGENKYSYKGVLKKHNDLYF